MREGGRPWWASGTDGSTTEHEDPLAAHRAARSGRDGGSGERTAGGSRGTTGRDGRPAMDEALAALGEAARAVRDGLGDRRDERAGHPHRSVETCRICPVCAAIRILGEARPELVEHLSEASRHLTLAAKAFVDAQAEAYGDHGGLERIEIDDDEGGGDHGPAADGPEEPA